MCAVPSGWQPEGYRLSFVRGGLRGFFGGIGLQFATGYTVAFLVYQLGTLFTTGSLGQGFFPGLAAVAVMIGIIVFLAVKAKAQDKVEYTLE